MKIGTGNRLKNRTNKGAYDSSGKRYRIIAVLLALALGLYTLTPTVKAEEMRTEKSGSAAAWTGLSSKGSLVYREGEKGAQIYAADFLLLWDRLDTIPDTIFEPASYTHTHQWEYLDINEETHTRHCEACGNTFDLVNAHRAQRRENCAIAHDEEEYPGIRCTCACGYQWEREESHTLFFETVDETCHRSRCRLDGTAFCPGYEPVTEEHYAYYFEPCEDGCHHEKICMDCGYRNEEECCFDLPDADSGKEGNSAGNREETDVCRRCQCGNVEKPDVGTGDENEDAEAGEVSSSAENGEENEDRETGEDASGAETGDENEDKETGEDPSDAEAGEEDEEREPEEETPEEETEKGGTI